MNIGIDGTFLQPESLHTGMGVYTRGLISKLVDISGSHNIVLVGYGPRPPAAPEGTVWHSLPALRVGRASPWLSHQLLLPHVVRQLDLDVLHIPGVNVRLSRPGIPFRCPCPLVVTMHDVIPLIYYSGSGPRLPWRLRLGYRLGLLATCRARMIVAVSQKSRTDILRHLDLSEDRVRAVANGLDACWLKRGRRRRTAQRQRASYLLYAGSFEPRKNLIGAVEAYRRALAETDLPPLVMIVERESGHRAAVMDAVKRSGVADRLHFVDSLDDDELVELYEGASLFIYPSFYEGFGFPPLQALARGVPVIASEAGSLPEVLGDAARYIDPGLPDELAAAIVELYTEPDRARQLAAAGPGRARAYTWESAAQKMLAVYEEAASHSPVAAPSTLLLRQRVP